VSSRDIDASRDGTYYGSVFGRSKALPFRKSAQYFARHRIVVPVVPISDILVCKRAFCRLLMPENEGTNGNHDNARVYVSDAPVGAFRTTFAFSFHKKGTDVRSVAFVVRIGACKLL